MSTDREPTPDERRGMEWWNNATEAERRHWMQRAGNTGVAADAYRAWCLDQERQHQEKMR